jgi:hypothetical protein
VDADLLALIHRHKAHFWEEYGVTLGYSKCTTRIRWWNDDSGMSLRRPRTAPISVKERTPDELDSDSVFPPIYIHPDIPGYLDIGEVNHDHVTMKVDTQTWALLQSIHEEMIQASAPFRTLVFFVMPPVIIFYFWVSIRLISQDYDSFPFLVGFAVFLIIFMVMIFKYDSQNLRIYQKVTQRVNTALQKDDATADLTLEFHDEVGKQQSEDRRYYQFVRHALMDPTREKEPKDDASSCTSANKLEE